MAGGWQNWDYPRHVGMAAILFRRERLADLTFRWEPDKCECLCCCHDLRRQGHGIGYLAGARPGTARTRAGRHTRRMTTMGPTSMIHRPRVPSGRRACDVPRGS